MSERGEPAPRDKSQAALQGPLVCLERPFSMVSGVRPPGGGSCSSGVRLLLPGLLTAGARVAVLGFLGSC